MSGLPLFEWSSYQVLGQKQPRYQLAVPPVSQILGFKGCNRETQVTGFHEAP